MSRTLSTSILVLTICSGLAFGQKSYAGSPYSSGSRVTYNTVQATPQYDLRRAEVPSGSRITLFANFLGKEAGCVMLQLAGTSTPCNVVQWKSESVTVELPKVSLAEPKNVEVVVILPTGRIAKTFHLLLVNQPDVMVHQDTVPQPQPPAPGAQACSFATSTTGGAEIYGK
jgi:hypothetical protein